LRIGLGIPIWIIQDNSISACQIETNTSRPCGAQHSKVGLISIEVVDKTLTGSDIRVAIKSTEFPPLHLRKSLDYVQHLLPLAKNQHTDPKRKRKTMSQKTFYCQLQNQRFPIDLTDDLASSTGVKSLRVPPTFQIAPSTTLLH
jgi:hypothetical protein